MRTIICTLVTKLPDDLPWTPTSYVLNELVSAPKSPPAPVTLIPIDPMVKGRIGVLQNDWRLVMNADALYLDGYNDHLYRVARQYNLKIYAPLYDESKDEELFAKMREKDTKPPKAAQVAVPVADSPAVEDDLFGGTPDADLFGCAGEPDLFGGEDLFA